MRVGQLLAIALVAGLLQAGGAAAEEHMGRDACRADVEKLCKGIEPGEGRLAKCMKEKEAQVSAGCKEHMAKMHEEREKKMRAFNEACKGDVEKFCKDVKPGDGRMVGCLRSNQASLSGSCKEQMDAMEEHRHQMGEKAHHMAEACKTDMQQYCKDVKPGEGRMARCLKENEAKLSESCKGSMHSMK